MSNDVLQQDLEQLRRAVADLESAANFLKGPYFEARLVEGMARAHAQTASPWLDRKAAADYARCSVSEIDRAANAGVFRRYVRAGTPLFKREDLDQAIENGSWTRAGVRGGKGETAKRRDGELIAA